MKEMVGGCCVCSDERGWPDNPLVYCDGNGCTVAVHQACYGIVTVPTGPWFCRKCESPETKGKVRCELCPSRSGALKRTDTGGWAHVVCALYIPEVRFGNVTSMEPIVLRLIPPERYNKTCYICHDLGKAHRSTAGACMQCNKSGCKQQFHVTCAQSLGLLCEEAGNYLDNVKYCGYCQHHYSKLFTNHEVTVIAKKKGGNVKTIPPYKPVPHDSHSSDSSGEKEGDASPLAGGSGTPTHAAKSKGPGRKSSHSSSSKSTPSSGKQTTPQPMDKKKSPNRRGSSTGEGSGSKNSTPAPSPQHTSDIPMPPKTSGTPTNPAKVSPPSVSPTIKAPEPVGVISSVASANAAAQSSAMTTPTTTSPAQSVVQSAKPAFQESVITNTEAMDTKHTKKRKAAAAAQAAAAAAAAAAVATDFSSTPPLPGQTNNDGPPLQSQTWEQREESQEPAEKILKRAKTDHEPQASHYPPVSSAPPPPPPAHSPSQPSSRHLHSPMPGPSGMIVPHPTIRSPSQHQVPISQASDMSAISPHIFHPPPQKPAALESGHSGHSVHGHPPRTSWGGLNVQYEQQHIPQDPNKPGGSGMAGPSKDPNTGAPMPPMAPMPPLPPTNIRNKKRAAMAAVVSMANPPLPPPSAPMPPAAIRNKKRAAMATVTTMETPPPPPENTEMASTSTQSLASVRRQPQPTPPPVYTETVKDSPPTSPGERPMKKTDVNKPMHTAPHMLGNELNPDSGVAARLQEQLSAELAAHAASTVGIDPLVTPPLMNKAAGNRTSSAQSLDQLLERQWEQGSQFLMEQAQHFDIASLLSCLHQLRTENVRLEEHVANLLQRRDHLLAVNARLAIPLNAAPAPPPEAPRCPRENGGQIRQPPPTSSRTETITSAHQSMAADQRSHQQLMMREVQQKPS